MLRTINFVVATCCFACLAYLGYRAPFARGKQLSERQALSDAHQKVATDSFDKAIKPDVMVIGFVGGFVGHENAVHSPVQLGQRLRKEYPAGVYIEVFENRRREEAHRKILEMLRNEKSGVNDGSTARNDGSADGSGGKDGAVTDERKKNAKIIIYGMSWGGSETVALARELEAEKIPVLLTVQVDSVAKAGQDDGVIPANVVEAVNFYQNDGLLHGRAEIHAADATRTRILGNFHYSYKTHPVNCAKYPWWDRWFAKYHTEIECDPEVWGRVEELIRSKLPSREPAE